MAGKKISELSGSLNPSITGVTAVAYGGTTYKTTLSTLRQVLVDSGSHAFTGSQTINGNLIVSGSITSQQYIVSSSITNVVVQDISGSSSFGNDLNDIHKFTGSLTITGSLESTNITAKEVLFVSGYAMIGDPIHHTGSNPEALHVGTTNSYNIAHFKGDNEYYSQVYLKNLNSGSNASTDLVVVADNGTETNHYIDLGINSSTYTGGLVGLANDSYLLNVGKDMYVGTVGGSGHPANLILFAENNWDDPQVFISGSKQIGFNTSSVSNGYSYEFSGSVKLQNELKINGSVTASYFVGDGSQLTNLPSQSLNTSSFATTGSNTFNGNQTINGSLILDNGAVIKDNSNNSVSFGYQAAETNQGTQSVAIGNGAGYENQQHGAIAIGPNAGAFTQESNGIAIGSLAGSSYQNTGSVAIGTQAGSTNQGVKSISVGYWAGRSDQEDYAISIGNLAGNTSQGLAAISIGNLAGSELQGSRSIAIGQQAGASNQGEYSIALGVLAGSMNQAANSIVINASGTVLQNTTTGSLKIAPIRNITGGSGILQYDDTTKEVSYSNTFSGSLTSSYFVGDGSGLTNLPTPTLISSGLSAPGSAVVANDTDVDINFSGVGTKFSFAQSGMTINGFTILSQVTSSFVDDTAAAAGGVPLQGLYRSGSFVMIRLT